MKATNVRLTVLSLALATVFLSSLASAERYMVVMKNRQTFAQLHSQLMLQENMNLASLRIQTNGHVAQPFAAASDVAVETSLENLNTLVISAESADQVRALEDSDQVLMVEKEIFHPAPKPVAGFALTKAWDFDVAMQPLPPGVSMRTVSQPWGIGAVHAPQAWTAGAKGQGVRVLVLDTGIDRDHPALKNQLEEGKDFSGGQTDDAYEFADHEGHGTHVSGTILAQAMSGGFVGVAPQAKLLMGRVCGEQGCSNIAVSQGINWGISKKVDVISMSLGGPLGTPAERRAVEAADKAGITVVAASGNDGKAKVSFPSAFPTVISVGAVDSTLKKADFSNWGPELDVVAPGVDVVSSVPLGSGRESLVLIENSEVVSTSFSGSPLVRSPAVNQLVAAGLGKPEDFKNVNVQGKFALILRGEIPFADKAKNAIAAGAAGVVIYNNAPGLIQGSLTSDGSTLAVPVVMIEQTTGEAIVKQLSAGKAVTASVQTIATDYASFAGTSMATPHVAGVVALLKSANKSLTSAQVMDVLKKTATPLGPNTNNEFGAGLVNAEKAVTTVRAN
jgi:serine protease